jgi:hypothetical protein
MNNVAYEILRIGIGDTKEAKRVKGIFYCLKEKT